MRNRMWAVLAGVLLIGTAPEEVDGGPAAYPVRLRVIPADGAPVQSLAIPGEIFAASQSRALDDVRMFDARGRPVPIARAAVASAPARNDRLKAMPILGAADMVKVTGVSLRLDEDGHARIARVDGQLAGGDAVMVLGALFDARPVAGTARKLVLDADLPAGQPVTFIVEASGNLKDWRPIAETVVYREQGAVADRGTDVSLGSAPIDRDYLRLSWKTSTRPLSPITVRGGVLVSEPGNDARLVMVDAKLPALTGDGAAEFAVPFASPVRAIRVTPQGDDLIVPVRVLGRDNDELGWRLLSEGVAARPGNGATPGSMIMLGDASVRSMRIEAVQSNAGFTMPPAIQFGFAPQRIVFAQAGPPPFTLAAGKAAPSAYLPLERLVLPSGALPSEAKVERSGSPILSLAPLNDASSRQRSMLLWVILLAATGLLGGMAWVLWRKSSKTEGDGAAS
jgi:hypothetical protein